MIQRIRKKFRDIFREEPFMVRSPGRVNLIGEHTDYNQGFVLPAAIDKAIFFAISPRDDTQCFLYANDLKATFQCSLKSLTKSDKRWPNYLLGVVDQLQQHHYPVKGFNCVFGGNIPIGAGLSSSAAIEAGLAFALNAIFELNLDKMTLVHLAQRAENEFVGVQCGIMDQLINIYGKKNDVLKLDCRSLEYEYVPFNSNEFRIVLCDTQVQRELAASEYNLRRTQCEQGVGVLQRFNPAIRSLRDVERPLLEDKRKEFDPVIFRRCKYVLDENDRVLSGCEDLKRGDLVSFGKRMYESHAGLRDEYEVSSPELDVLVDGAARIDGVVGARMMGAGFGGCTINLVRQDRLENFLQEIDRIYRNQLDKQPKTYVTKIDDGTKIYNEEMVSIPHGAR